MNWAARILLVGILAIASISMLGAAIAIAAPYIAALIVLWGVGKLLTMWFPMNPED
jgi:hypothetical protein